MGKGQKSGLSQGMWGKRKLFCFFMKVSENDRDCILKVGDGGAACN